MFQMIKQLLANEQGQGMTEYGLIIAFVAIVVIGVLTTMGGQLTTVFTNITNGLKGPSAGA